eukprot:Sspe_Gene.47673::Locus_24429_Transcript_1_1_Confidence_1.000_Length_5004::g.47673::m.47673
MDPRDVGHTVLLAGSLQAIVDSGDLFVPPNTSLQVLEVIGGAECGGEGTYYIKASDGASSHYLKLSPTLATLIETGRLCTGQLFLLERLDHGRECPVAHAITPLACRCETVGSPVTPLRKPWEANQPTSLRNQGTVRTGTPKKKKAGGSKKVGEKKKAGEKSKPVRPRATSTPTRGRQGRATTPTPRKGRQVAATPPSRLTSSALRSSSNPRRRVASGSTKPPRSGGTKLQQRSSARLASRPALPPPPRSPPKVSTLCTVSRVPVAIPTYSGSANAKDAMSGMVASVCVGGGPTVEAGLREYSRWAAWRSDDELSEKNSPSSSSAADGEELGSVRAARCLTYSESDLHMETVKSSGSSALGCEEDQAEGHRDCLDRGEHRKEEVPHVALARRAEGCGGGPPTRWEREMGEVVFAVMHSEESGSDGEWSDTRSDASVEGGKGEGSGGEVGVSITPGWEADTVHREGGPDNLGRGVGPLDTEGDQGRSRSSLTVSEAPSGETSRSGYRGHRAQSMEHLGNMAMLLHQSERQGVAQTGNMGASHGLRGGASAFLPCRSHPQWDREESAGPKDPGSARWCAHRSWGGVEEGVEKSSVNQSSHYQQSTVSSGAVTEYHEREAIEKGLEEEGQHDEQSEGEEERHSEHTDDQRMCAVNLGGGRRGKDRCSFASQAAEDTDTPLSCVRNTSWHAKPQWGDEWAERQRRENAEGPLPHSASPSAGEDEERPSELLGRCSSPRSTHCSGQADPVQADDVLSPTLSSTPSQLSCGHQLHTHDGDQMDATGGDQLDVRARDSGELYTRGGQLDEPGSDQLDARSQRDERQLNECGGDQLCTGGDQLNADSSYQPDARACGRDELYGRQQLDEPDQLDADGGHQLSTRSSQCDAHGSHQLDSLSLHNGGRDQLYRSEWDAGQLDEPGSGQQDVRGDSQRDSPRLDEHCGKQLDERGRSQQPKCGGDLYTRGGRQWNAYDSDQLEVDALHTRCSSERDAPQLDVCGGGQLDVRSPGDAYDTHQLGGHCGDARGDRQLDACVSGQQEVCVLGNDQLHTCGNGQLNAQWDARHLDVCDNDHLDMCGSQLDACGGDQRRGSEQCEARVRGGDQLDARDTRSGDLDTSGSGQRLDVVYLRARNAPDGIPEADRSIFQVHSMTGPQGRVSTRLGDQPNLPTTRKGPSTEEARTCAGIGRGGSSPCEVVRVVEITQPARQHAAPSCAPVSTTETLCTNGCSEKLAVVPFRREPSPYDYKKEGCGGLPADDERKECDGQIDVLVVVPQPSAPSTPREHESCHDKSSSARRGISPAWIERGTYDVSRRIATASQWALENIANGGQGTDTVVRWDAVPIAQGRGRATTRCPPPTHDEGEGQRRGVHGGEPPRRPGGPGARGGVCRSGSEGGQPGGPGGDRQTPRKEGEGRVRGDLRLHRPRSAPGSIVEGVEPGGPGRPVTAARLPLVSHDVNRDIGSPKTSAPCTPSTCGVTPSHETNTGTQGRETIEKRRADLERQMSEVVELDKLARRFEEVTASSAARNSILVMDAYLAYFQVATTRQLPPKELCGPYQMLIRESTVWFERFLREELSAPPRLHRLFTSLTASGAARDVRQVLALLTRLRRWVVSHAENSPELLRLIATSSHYLEVKEGLLT